MIMWFIFSIYGLLLIGIVYVLRQKRWKKRIRLLFFMILIILFLSVAYLDREKMFLGNQAFYNQTPYRHLIFYILMLFGMFSAYLRKAIEERRLKINMLEEQKKQLEEKKKNDEEGRITPLFEKDVQYKKPSISFDRWEIIYPLLFSIPTFGALYELVKPLNGDYLTIANIVISFQTGFFWQTLQPIKNSQAGNTQGQNQP